MSFWVLLKLLQNPAEKHPAETATAVTALGKQLRATFTQILE
jgi:hypothetical protein